MHPAQMAMAVLRALPLGQPRRINAPEIQRAHTADVGHKVDDR